MLSYLLLRLPPQWWPGSGCTLCTVHLQVLVALSFAFVSDFFSFQLYSVHFTGYNFASAFLLRFRWEICKPFVLFFQLEVSCSYHSTQFWTHSFSRSYFSCIVARTLWAVFDPGLPSNPAHSFSFRFLPLILFVNLIFRVTFKPTIQFFCFNPTLPLSIRSFFCPTVASNF